VFETFSECYVVVFGVTSVGVQTAHDDGAFGFGYEFRFVGEVHYKEEP
jgi:hypothetical protein